MISKLFSLWNILSLDVAAGALGGGFLVARVLGVEMPWSWYLLLPAGVWLVYTADHLVDALRLGKNAHTQRHLFHYQFRVVLVPLLLVVCISGGWIAFVYLPEEMMSFGAGLAFFSVLHIVLVKFVGERVSPLLVKESGVAIAYCGGVLGFPFIASGQDISAEALLGFAQLFMIALINLLIYSLFEYESDRVDGHTSFVLATGKKKAVSIVGILIFLVGIAGGIVLLTGSMVHLRMLQPAWLMITAVHAAILYFPGYFAKGLKYRLVGDGVFLIQWIGVFF